MNLAFSALLMLLWTNGFLQAAQPHPVIISEMMADPFPARGLPEAEYIELKNVTTDTIDLSNWTISDGNSKARIPEGTLLAADGFLILCAKAYVVQFESHGKVAGVSGFPSLDNDGDLIVIASADGKTVHAVEFSSEWRYNPLKSGGGWSIEMLDTKFPCDQRNNWNYSIDPLGGTPGRENTAQPYIPGNAGPIAIHSYARDSIHIIVEFSNALDSTSGSDEQLYHVNNSIGQPKEVIVLPPLFKTIELMLNKPLIPGNIYQLEFSGVSDCYGLKKSHSVSINTGLAIDGVDRLIFNELLFNPRSGGSDFVELFHAGNSALDASRIFLAGRNSSDQIYDPVKCSETPLLIFPGDFLVFTTDTLSVSKEYKVKKPAFLKALKHLPSLPDDRGCIVLLNEAGQILDEFRYTEQMHYPLLANNEGVSLERVNPNEETQNAQNWFSAAADIGYATPGDVNSQLNRLTEEPVEIVTDEVFSPDHDGFDDLLTIRYKFADPGNNCSISIFDRAGYLVRTLIRNQVCGTRGFFKWDGLNENNQKLNAGIYFLVIDLFRLNGKKKTIRKTVVLAYRGR